MVLPVYNPSYSGGRDKSIMVGGQPKQKLTKTLPIEKPIQVQWLMPIISATR
jgi:hypothetical protein